ncbi:MAG: TolC family protein [bacterium]
MQVETLRGTAQQAATRVRKAFYRVLLASEQVRLTENSVQRVRQVLEESRARNRAGLTSDYDVLRLEVQLSNLHPQLRQARDGLEAARRRLTLEMALPVESPVKAAGSLTAIDLETYAAGDRSSRQLLEVAGVPDASEMGYERVLSTALVDRADLRQGEINLELDDARIMRAMSEFFPTLSAFYSYNLSAQENDSPDFFGENSRQRAGNQSAGLQLQIPIFSGFQRFARVRQEKLGREQDRTRLHGLRQQAADQVKTLLASLEETRLRALAQARSVGQAERGFEIASAQYGEGVGSRLEVVDAENALRQAQFNYAQAVYDYLDAQADLDLAVGRVPLVDEVMEVEVEDR